MGELFNLVFKNPTINLLAFFYTIFLKIGLPGAFGFAIIGLTSSIRLLLNPFFSQQIQLSKKMADAKPHLDKLTEKHKNDKKKLQEEQMKLYKEMGINPASGCVFALIQMPVFIALYQVLLSFFKKGQSMNSIITTINKSIYLPFFKIHSIDPNFFGLNLAVPPSQFAKYGLFYLGIPIITGVLQYFQISLSTPPAAPKKVNDGKKEGKKDDDMQTMMSTQMKYIFPVMIGYFAYTLPSGLALYWNIFSLFSIWQYRKNQKLQPMKAEALMPKNK